MGVSVLIRLTCYPSIKLSTIESRCTPPVRKLSFRSITERMEAGRILTNAIESGHVGQHLEVLDLDPCNLGHMGLATRTKAQLARAESLAIRPEVGGVY